MEFSIKTIFYPTDSIKVKKDETILIRVSRKIYNFFEHKFFYINS